MPDASGVAAYRIEMSTQSFLFIEILWFRRNKAGNDFWNSKFVVYKAVFKENMSTTVPVIVRQAR